MSLELSKPQGCLKYSNHVFEIWQVWLSSIAAEPSVKFPSDWKIWNINFMLFFSGWKEITHYDIVVSLSYLSTSYTYHPNVAWTPQLSTVDGPLGDPGFSTLDSTEFSSNDLQLQLTQPCMSFTLMQQRFFRKLLLLMILDTDHVLCS